MHYNVPDFFYKYMSCSTAKILLRNKTIRWNSPLNFNDTFELNYSMGMDFDESNAVNIIAQKLARVIYDDKINLHDNGLRSPKLDKIRKYLRKDSYPIEHFTETIKSIAIKLLPKVINIIEKAKERWQKDITNYRILCFTDVNDSILMWERYAEKHSGVVIKWKPIAEIDSPLYVAHPVIYSDELPDIATYEYLIDIYIGLKPAKPIIDEFITLVTTKKTSWADENEWRIVSTKRLSDSGMYEDVPFFPQEIDAVYLGCKISDGDKKDILESIEERFSHVSVYQAYMDDDNRRITFKTI